MRAPAIWVMGAVLAAMALGGCGVARSINGGVFALPTTRGHVPVGGVVAGQFAMGDERYVGVDATLRATGDYGSLALGGHVAAIAAGEPAAPYARLGFAPLALSLRDDTPWYAMDASLEGGIQFNVRNAATRGVFGSTDHAHSALTLGLRGDLEYRPGQAEADVFVSLMFGFVMADTTNFRAFTRR